LLHNLSPRAKVVVGVVAAVVIAMIGFTIGSLSGGHDHPGEGSADVGFARDMSTHHRQAVEMGMIAFQHSSTPDVSTLGGDIAMTQQSQIGMMQAWLKEWGVGPNSSAPPMLWMPDGQRSLNGNLMPGMATREEIEKLKAAQGTELDILFLQYMLRHHLGGIHMVDGLLADNPSPDVRDLAETMKRNQAAEVTVMKTMLAELGAKPL
jgi:uncharacterized protein (DUF305 family)